MKLKYQKQIDCLLSEGLKLPALGAPNGIEAYRFVFLDENKNNHKPVSIQKPSRRLPDNKKLSGFALSCFNSQLNAEQRYKALCKSFKNTPKTIGDSLSSGRLNNEDGLVTAPDKISGHFDLYESSSCNLSKTFKIIETLWRS